MGTINYLKMCQTFSRMIDEVEQQQGRNNIILDIAIGGITTAIETDDEQMLKGFLTWLRMVYNQCVSTNNMLKVANNNLDYALGEIEKLLPPE